MGFINWLLGLLGLANSPEAMMRRAAGMAERGNVTKAVEIYKKVIEQNPYLASAYGGLGKVYYRMDFREQADREFTIADSLDALRADPSNIKAVLAMAKAMMAKGMHSHARANLTPFLRTNPNNAELLKLLGLVHKALNNDNKAREFLQKALELDPRNADIYLRMGELELKVGNKKEGNWMMAMSRLLNKLEAEPAEAKNQLQVGQLFLEKEKFQESVPFFSKAVELDHKLVDAQLGLALAYKGLSQPAAAVETLKKAIKIEPEEPRIYRLMAEMHTLTGDFNAARQAREMADVLQAGREGSHDPVHAGRYITYLMQQQRMAQAQARLEDAISRWPQDLGLKLLMARMLIADGRQDSAIQVLKEIVAIDENMVDAHLLLATTHNYLGQNMAALAEGQLATRLAPNNPDAHKILADIYRDQKKFSLAAASYETADRLKSKGK